MVSYPREPEASDRMWWAGYGAGIKLIAFHLSKKIYPHLGLLALVCSALHDGEVLRQLIEPQYVPREESATWGNDRNSIIDDQ